MRIAAVDPAERSPTHTSRLLRKVFVTSVTVVRGTSGGIIARPVGRKTLIAEWFDNGQALVQRRLAS